MRLKTSRANTTGTLFGHTDTDCTLVFEDMWAVVKDLGQRQLPGWGRRKASYECTKKLLHDPQV